MRELIYEYCIDAITYFRDKHFPVENTEHNEVRQEINHVISTISNSYVLVHWPKSQQYMEEPWFDDEAVLAQDLGDVSSGAYFIPLKRLIQ